MSKAMLIMDMPESCAGCKLSICLKDIGIGRCFATMELFDSFAKVQDWCPLREVPEKDSKSYCPDEYEDGYNYCIDKILNEN